MKIIKNAIRCNICGDEIESTNVHEFVRCSCGACAVDGGHDYLRWSFREEGCFTDISVVEEDDFDFDEELKKRKEQTSEIVNDFINKFEQRNVSQNSDS